MNKKFFGWRRGLWRIVCVGVLVFVSWFAFAGAGVFRVWGVSRDSIADCPTENDRVRSREEFASYLRYSTEWGNEGNKFIIWMILTLLHSFWYPLHPKFHRIKIQHALPLNPESPSPASSWLYGVGELRTESQGGLKVRSITVLLVPCGMYNYSCHYYALSETH